MTITNSKGLNAEPRCIPIFTSKRLLLPWTVLTTVFAPVCIDITADTNYSSTPNLHIAHLVTSLGTLWKAVVEFYSILGTNSGVRSNQRLLRATEQELTHSFLHWKYVTYLTLVVFVLKPYIDELKWCINSEWAALGNVHNCTLLNVLLALVASTSTVCNRAGGHFEHML